MQCRLATIEDLSFMLNNFKRGTRTSWFQNYPCEQTFLWYFRIIFLWSRLRLQLIRAISIAIQCAALLSFSFAPPWMVYISQQNRWLCIDSEIPSLRTFSNLAAPSTCFRNHINSESNLLVLWGQLGHLHVSRLCGIAAIVEIKKEAVKFLCRSSVGSIWHVMFARHLPKYSALAKWWQCVLPQ